jgi:hypothetical protein
MVNALMQSSKLKVLLPLLPLLNNNMNPVNIFNNDGEDVNDGVDVNDDIIKVFILSK